MTDTLHACSSGMTLECATLFPQRVTWLGFGEGSCMSKSDERDAPRGAGGRDGEGELEERGRRDAAAFGAREPPLSGEDLVAGPGWPIGVTVAVTAATTEGGRPLSATTEGASRAGGCWGFGAVGPAASSPSDPG
jgi:hypothetical protein